MRKPQRHVALASVVVVTWMAGCGKERSELGLVEGLVTLDGQPLANAVVEFHPVDIERSSYDGQTDKTGRYQLYASAKRKGAEPGEYTVHITLPNRGTDSPATAQPTIPAKYHARTELKVTVKKGRNKLDFPLSSK